MFYILGNGKGTLYVGMTNDLERRIYEHKTKAVKGFTYKYNVDQLVFFEEFSDVYEAMDAERRIKLGYERRNLN